VSDTVSDTNRVLAHSSTRGLTPTAAPGGSDPNGGTGRGV